MNSSDGKWRIQHYIADLRDIENILGISKKDQGLDSASRSYRDTGVPAAIRSYEETLRSPTSLFPGGTRDTTVGSALPTNLATRVPMDTSQDYGLSTQMTSPTTAAPASVSPAPSAFITSTRNVLQCPECQQPFSGKPSDAKKNLDRHISCQHSQKAGVKCPQQDCRYTTTRTDNLSQHLKRTHKITDPQEYDRAFKKIKREAAVSEGA